MRGRVSGGAGTKVGRRVNERTNASTREQVHTHQNIVNVRLYILYRNLNFCKYLLGCSNSCLRELVVGGSNLDVLLLASYIKAST